MCVGWYTVKTKMQNAPVVFSRTRVYLMHSPKIEYLLPVYLRITRHDSPQFSAVCNLVQLAKEHWT